jgi:hypothetical protein
MKIKAVLATLLASVAIHGATAGDWCAPSSDAKCPVECAPEPLGFTLDNGYDSAYYFRGLWFSNNNLWHQLTYTKQLCDKWSFTAGAYYTSTQNTILSRNAAGIEGAGVGNLDYSELDLFTSVTYDATWARFTLGYTDYHFFDTFSGSINNGQTNGLLTLRDSQLRDAREVNLLVTVPLGANANIYGLYANDFRIGGQYAEAGADYTIAVSDCFSIIPSVQVGYNINNYYTYHSGNGQPVLGAPRGAWNHIRPMITAPFKITDSVTFIPYVAANISLDARELINSPLPGPGATDFYGGARLSFTF